MGNKLCATFDFRGIKGQLTQAHLENEVSQPFASSNNLFSDHYTSIQTLLFLERLLLKNPKA